MASFVYNEAKRAFLQGEINLASDDIRLLAVSTNTTADTEDDVNTLSGFTTLDEFDGANYVRKSLSGETVGEDAANNRAEFDATDVTFPALGAGTRPIDGFILYKFVTNDSSSIPIAYIDPPSNFNGNGGDVTITWNAEGILQAA